MSIASSANAMASSKSPSVRYQEAIQCSSAASKFLMPSFWKSASASFAARIAPSVAPDSMRAEAMACKARASPLVSPSALNIGMASFTAFFASSALFFLSPGLLMYRLDKATNAAAMSLLSPPDLKVAKASVPAFSASSLSALPSSKLHSAYASCKFASAPLSNSSLTIILASLAFPWKESTCETIRSASAVPSLSPAPLNAASASSAAFSASGYAILSMDFPASTSSAAASLFFPPTLPSSAMAL
mmetsp:Transcript_111924/g.250090  ORF Transcript_111924/g.250090 Transcript_111924/m.250090 type:complete len:246 (-) Transcript_111924:136-873(-)